MHNAYYTMKIHSHDIGAFTLDMHFKNTSSS